MGQAPGHGKRLGLLPLIRRHEDDVEIDLQQVYSIDYRDYYRPDGGASRLTTRRLLLLVDGLPRESSRFWCAVTDMEPITWDQIILADIYAVLTKELHPVRTRREDQRKRRDTAAKKARVAARERRRAQMKKNLGTP